MPKSIGFGSRIVVGKKGSPTTNNLLKPNALHKK